MAKGIKKTWPVEQFLLSSTSAPVLIGTVRAGESATVQASGDNAGDVFIGPDENVADGRGVELLPGSSYDWDMSTDKDIRSYIELWAIPDTANDVVIVYKLRTFTPVSDIVGET